MNLKQSLAGIGFAIGAVISLATPSFAGSLMPSQLGLEPFDPSKPITDGTSGTLSSFPYATKMFSFKYDTTVKFDLLNPSGLGSRGKALSSFGFLTNPVNGSGGFTSIFSETNPYNSGSGNSNDWLGSCGTNQAIQGSCRTSVTFKAGVNYQLALNTDGTTHYGVGALDSFTFNKQTDQYYPKSNQFTTVAEPGALFIGMEDAKFANYTTSSKDDYFYDYQDWVVKASVPEPATLAGLGMVAGGMLMARRRRVTA